MIRSLLVRNDNSGPCRREDATWIDLFFLPKAGLRVLFEVCGSRCPLLLNLCLILWSQLRQALLSLTRPLHHRMKNSWAKLATLIE